MKKFAITVTREISQTANFEIEAETEDEACELAEDEILNIADDGWDDDVELNDPEITKAVEVIELSEDAESEDAESEEAAEQEAA